MPWRALSLVLFMVATPVATFGALLVSDYLRARRAAKRVVDELEHVMRVAREALIMVRDQVLGEMREGLEKEDAMLHMLPSYVDRLPTGEERGRYYALDLGGTNLRVAMVELGPRDREVSRIVVEEGTVPGNLLLAPASYLFAHLALQLSKMIERHGDPTEVARVGFSFSFPMRQQDCHSGELLYWTKGYKCSGAVGQDAVQMLQRALDDSGTSAKVEVILNNALTPLLSSQYCHGPTKVAAIFGTGTNMSYVEQADRIKKLKGYRGGQEMLINAEWANFWHDCLPTVQEDARVDEASHNHGTGRFEKLISGMHLGEVARRLIHRMWRAAAAEMPRWEVPVRLESGRDLLTSAHVGRMAADVTEELAEVAGQVQESFGAEMPKFMRPHVQRICQLVLERAGRLGAAAVAAAIEQTEALKGEGEVLVGAEGSLIRYNERFRRAFMAGLRMVLGPQQARRVRLTVCEDGAVLGAALAVACCGDNAARSDLVGGYLVISSEAAQVAEAAVGGISSAPQADQVVRTPPANPDRQGKLRRREGVAR